MSKLVDKATKTVIRTMFCMFNKLVERLKRLEIWKYI